MMTVRGVRRVAVDIGALGPAGGGISTYLRTLLPRLSSDPLLFFNLYGRRPSQLGGLNLPRAETRWDRFPFHAGRIAALFTTMPVWAQLDQPDVFWGPAHRLPIHLPKRSAAVVTIHDLAWWRTPHTMRRTGRILDSVMMRFAVRRAQVILAVSHATEADLAERFPGSASKITVTPLAAEMKDSSSLKKSSSWAGKNYWLFVGTLEPRKNLRRLLGAYAYARKQEDRFPELVLVGGRGWGDMQVEKWLDGLGIAEHVRILGHVTSEMLNDIYRNAFCLVMPSLYEGFGLPLLEAMRWGVPAITSDRSSMPEVGGAGAILVNPESESSIADALLLVFRSRAKYSELVAGAQRQTEKFSWERTAEKTREALLSV